MDNFDFYLQILGLDRATTRIEIKEAYRRLAKQWHPDLYTNQPQLLAEAQRKFQQINQAYEILKDYNPREATTNQNVTRNNDIKIKKTASEIHYQRGVEFAEVEDYQTAIAEFSQAIKLNTNYLNAYQYRGFILSKLGYELRASSDFQQVDRLQAKAKIDSNRVRYNTNYRANPARIKKNKLEEYRQRFIIILQQFWLFFSLVIIAFVLVILS